MSNRDLTGMLFIGYVVKSLIAEGYEVTVQDRGDYVFFDVLSPDDIRRDFNSSYQFLSETPDAYRALGEGFLHAITRTFEDVRRLKGA